MLGEMLKNVREKNPLIYNITNYVTVNDCANILLAVGASPLMSDEIAEAKELAKISEGININIGTLTKRTIKTMMTAGKISKLSGHTVLLDPVGAGASKLRTKTAMDIVRKIKPDVVRGNISEIKALCGGSGNTKGVDADLNDTVTDENLQETVEKIKKFSKKINGIVAITGAIDIVSDENKTYCIRNGHEMMSKITGTGCQLSAMTAAFIAANKENRLEAVAAAVCAMGLAGEIARERLTEKDGNATYSDYIIDAIYNITPEQLEKGAKYEVR